MTAKEADQGPQTRNQPVEPRGLAYPAAAAPMGSEPNTCRRVMDKDNVHRVRRAESLDLIASVVSPRVSLKMFRRALEI